jgi:hypothetical protein
MMFPLGVMVGGGVKGVDGGLGSDKNRVFCVIKILSCIIFNGKDYTIPSILCC